MEEGGHDPRGEGINQSSGSDIQKERKISNFIKGRTNFFEDRQRITSDERGRERKSAYGTMGNKSASLDITDKGEDFSDIEAVASDDSIDDVFKPTHLDGPSAKQFDDCPAEDLEFKIRFDELKADITDDEEAHAVSVDEQVGPAENVSKATDQPVLIDITATLILENLTIEADPAQEVDDAKVLVEDRTSVVEESMPVTLGEKFDETYPIEGNKSFTATVIPASNGTKGKQIPIDKELTTDNFFMKRAHNASDPTPLIDVTLVPGSEDVTILVDAKPEVEEIRVGIKDPEGETAVDETEEIVAGEEFSKTCDVLELFKTYSTDVTPVANAKDERPVKNNFTMGKEFASFDVTDKGEDFLDIEAMASDDFTDDVVSKLTHLDEAGEEQFDDSPAEDDLEYKTKFNELEPDITYDVEAHPVSDDEQVGPAENVTEATDQPVSTDFTATHTYENITLKADPAQEVDDAQELIEDEDRTSVVEESVPVTLGKKCDETYPINANESYTATVTPDLNETKGKPIEKELTTDQPVSTDFTATHTYENITLKADSAQEVDDAQEVTEDENRTSVVEESVPVTLGEKCDETYPIDGNESCTATVTPDLNETKGKPIEKELTTENALLIEEDEVSHNFESTTVNVIAGDQNIRAVNNRKALRRKVTKASPESDFSTTKYFMERYVHDLGTKIEETIHSLWKQYSSEQLMLSKLAEK